MEKQKKIRKIGIICTLGISIVFGGTIFAQLPNWGEIDPIITQDASQVINTEICEEGDTICIRQGTAISVRNPQDDGHVEGVIDYDQNFFSKHSEAISATMKIIQRVINYTLGFLAIIALIYLLYHGFLIVTAGNDDSKTKKGKGGIKTAAIALVGVGLSRSFVSLIIWLVNLITK